KATRATRARNAASAQLRRRRAVPETRAPAMPMAAAASMATIQARPVPSAALSEAQKARATSSAAVRPSAVRRRTSPAWAPNAGPAWVWARSGSVDLGSVRVWLWGRALAMNGSLHEDGRAFQYRHHHEQADRLRDDQRGVGRREPRMVQEQGAEPGDE